MKNIFQSMAELARKEGNQSEELKIRKFNSVGLSKLQRHFPCGFLCIS